MLPSIQQVFSFLEKCLSCSHQKLQFPIYSIRSTDPLLSRLADVSLCFEKRSDVKGLRAPDAPVNSPIEGELQAPSIQ